MGLEIVISDTVFEIPYFMLKPTYNAKVTTNLMAKKLWLITKCVADNILDLRDIKPSGKGSSKL